MASWSGKSSNVRTCRLICGGGMIFSEECIAVAVSSAGRQGDKSTRVVFAGPRLAIYVALPSLLYLLFLRHQLKAVRHTKLQQSDSYRRQASPGSTLPVALVNLPLREVMLPIPVGRFGILGFPRGDASSSLAATK